MILHRSFMDGFGAKKAAKLREAIDLPTITP